MNKETYRKLMDKIQFSDDLTQNVMEKIDSLQDQRFSLSSLQKRITALTAVLGIAAAAVFGIYNFSGNISENQMHTSGYSSTVESVSAKADGTVKDISIEPQEIMVFDYDNANQENISTILAAIKGKTQSYDIGYVNNGTYTCLKHQISDSLIHLSASTENSRNFKWYVKNLSSGTITVSARISYRSNDLVYRNSDNDTDTLRVSKGQQISLTHISSCTDNVSVQHIYLYNLETMEQTELRLQSDSVFYEIKNTGTYAVYGITNNDTVINLSSYFSIGISADKNIPFSDL